MLKCVYFFEFTTYEDNKATYGFIANSQQMAWITAATYIGCHVLNPAVTAIKFLNYKYIVNNKEFPNEISESDALKLILNPKLTD